jgi:hypothetical protein
VPQWILVEFQHGQLPAKLGRLDQIDAAKDTSVFLVGKAEERDEMRGEERVGKG